MGKSTLVAEIAAHVTRGIPLPGDPRTSLPPGNVLLLSAEDGAADTIRPRLDRAKADMARVHLLTDMLSANGKEEHPTLRNPFHVAALLNAIQRLELLLVVIDPVTAYLGQTDSYKDAEVRAVLAPLAKMAEETATVVLLIRHLRKAATTKAIHRAGGSIAFTAAVRTSILVGSDPSEPARRVVIPIKNNLAPEAAPVAFTLEDGGLSWVEAPQVTAQDLLAGDETSDDRSLRSEASDWLVDRLRGGPVPADRLLRDIVAIGISKRTLYRAKDELKVTSIRKSDGSNGAGSWSWQLPPESSAMLATLPKASSGHLARNPMNAGDSAESRSQGVQRGWLTTLQTGGDEREEFI